MTSSTAGAPTATTAEEVRNRADSGCAVGGAFFNDPMDVALTVSSIVGGLSLPSLAVTLILYVAGQRRAGREAVAERQRQLVEDVLDVVATTMRRQSSLARYVSAPAEVDFGALYPRVLLAVDKGNEDIAAWVWRQVQHMLASAAPEEPIRLGGLIAGKLMAWQRGDLGLSWFRAELERDPVDDEFRVPARTQLVRMWRQAGKGFAGGALIAAAGLTWKASTR